MIPIPELHACRRHEFDEADGQGFFQGQLSELENFVVIEPLNGHYVEFHGEEPYVKGLFDPHLYLGKSIPSGDVGKFLPVQRIEAYVNPLDSGLGQILGEFAQEDSIGGQA